MLAGRIVVTMVGVGAGQVRVQLVCVVRVAASLSACFTLRVAASHFDLENRPPGVLKIGRAHV